jgi:signal transduction histidine kinase
MTLIDVSDLREAVAARHRSETELLQVEERLRSAVRIAPIAVLSFDASLRVTWAYVMGRELGAMQLDLSSIFSQHDADEMLRAVGTASSDRRGQRVELRVHAKQHGDEGERVFDFRIEPTPTGVTVVGFDITASKAAETALRETDKRKDEFLATLSHELRNPLAPLKIAIEVARLVGDDPTQREESLAVMERQVTMLSQLVDELLDQSRITQGKLRLDLFVFELTPILERAVTLARPLIDEAKHELQLRAPQRSIKVNCDMRRLVQVFGNLLTNAAKYTPAGGKIDVDVTTDVSGRRVVVRIEDNGIGIPPQNLATIFDIFVQSRDAEGRSRGGLGIGLNVVRRLVELHGGTVTATSDGRGAGSVFTVELPIETDD